jgi:hypothetical protein
MFDGAEPPTPHMAAATSYGGCHFRVIAKAPPTWLRRLIDLGLIRGGDSSLIFSDPSLNACFLHRVR